MAEKNVSLTQEGRTEDNERGRWLMQFVPRGGRKA